MLVYICSPYSAKTKKGIKKNIEIAKKLGKEIFDLGLNYIPVIPHLNFSFIEKEDEKTRERILSFCGQLVSICDMVYINNEKGITEGMKREIKIAKKYGKGLIYRKEGTK